MNRTQLRMRRALQEFVDEVRAAYRDRGAVSLFGYALLVLFASAQLVGSLCMIGFFALCASAGVFFLGAALGLWPDLPPSPPPPIPELSDSDLRDMESLLPPRSHPRYLLHHD